MIVSLIAGLLAVADVAEAAAELQLKSTRPVLLSVDGRVAKVTGNLRLRAANLDGGVHDVKITGLFGKVLYEGEIELEDGRITHAEWAGADLRIVGTEALAAAQIPAWRRGIGVDDDPEEGVTEEPEVDGDEPVAVDREAVLEDVDDAAVVEASPGGLVPEAPVDDLPLAIPYAPPELAAAAEEPLPTGPGREMSVELQPSMRLEVVHGGVTVWLTAREGSLVIEDDRGMALTLRDAPAE